ncbi:MAG: SPOR domain-containing protein [Candidatus Thorarchaeota archaeon]
MSLSKKTIPIWGGLPLLGVIAFVIGLAVRAEVWDNSDFSLLDNSWGDIVITSGILLIIGLSVLLGFAGTSRHKIWSFSFLWFLIAFLGALTVTVGILVRTEVLTESSNEIFVKNDWLDFILIGAILLGTGLALFLGTLNEGPRAKNIIWKFTPLLMIVMLAGLAFILIGAAFGAEYLTEADLEFLADYKWEELYVIGLLLFIPAISMILVSLPDSTREKVWKLRVIWFIMAFAGIIIALMGILATFYVFDQNTMAFEGDYSWIELTLYSVPLLVLGLGSLLASAPAGTRSRIAQLNPLWVNLIGFGGILLLLDLLRRYELLDKDLIALFAVLPWGEFVVIGLIPLVIGLSITFSTRIGEPTGFADIDISMVEDTSADPSQISTDPNEQLAYLDISLQATRSSLASLRDKQRKKEISDSFAKKLFGRFSLGEKRLIRIQERVKREAERADLRRAFEAETKPEARKVPKPPSPKAAEEKAPEVTPTPAEAPAVPKPAASPARTPPPTPPKPSAPPPAAPRPPPTVPTPSAPPTPASAAPAVPKDSSLLTKAADTQSTSISELRGEMLKELRRLRDIFKEE